VKKLVTLFSRTAREERGITGLETAIILIAFVVVATVFAFVVLTTGVFSSERGKETVFAGLQKARGSMELRGGVVAEYDGTDVTNIEFAVANSAGGEPIPLDPTATQNRTVIAYRDGTIIQDDVDYTVTWVVGDSDDLLEPGELAVISIDPTTIDNGAATPVPASLVANSRFTFEVQSPVGAVLDITRQLPAALDAVMQLH
jgi:flagellin FlaB